MFQILKLYAWEPSFQQSVTEVREKELVHVRNINVINALTYISWFLMPFLVSGNFVINIQANYSPSVIGRKGQNSSVVYLIRGFSK